MVISPRCIIPSHLMACACLSKRSRQQRKIFAPTSPIKTFCEVLIPRFTSPRAQLSHIPTLPVAPSSQRMRDARWTRMCVPAGRGHGTELKALAMTNPLSQQPKQPRGWWLWL